MHLVGYDLWIAADPFSIGYRYLAVAQGKLGHPILNDLPNAGNKGWYQMYDAMDKWLKGEEIDLYWEHPN